MNFLHQFNPQPIIFQLGPITVRWYGLIIVLGLLFGFLLVRHLTKARGIKPDDVYDLGFWLVLSGIVGARLYEVFFINWSYYYANPLAIAKIWQGGLAIHGVIIGGVITLYVWVRIKKQSFWLWSDMIVVALILGQAIGRWGNYFNQELFGWPTSLPWGIPIELAHRPLEFMSYEFFHPTFLYESLLNFVLFLVLLYLIKKKNFQAGVITAIYFIGYSIIRFMMEFIRIDQTPEFWSLRLPQWASVVIVIATIIVLFLKKNKINTSLSSRAER